MKIRILAAAFLATLNSCLYKAGNRQPDLELDIKMSVNSFYVERFLKETFGPISNSGPRNSELINFPSDFFALDDTLNKVRYVIENRVSDDSLKNNGWGLEVSSIYDFSNGLWVYDRKKVTDIQLEKIKSYLVKNVIIPVIQQNKGVVADSILFINDSSTRPYLELHWD